MWLSNEKLHQEIGLSLELIINIFLFFFFNDIICISILPVIYRSLKKTAVHTSQITHAVSL